MEYWLLLLSLLSLVTVVWLRRLVPDLELLTLYCIYLIGLQPIYVVITINLKLIRMMPTVEAAIVSKSLGLLLYPIISLWLTGCLMYSRLRVVWKVVITFTAQLSFTGLDYLLVATGYLRFTGWGLVPSLLRHAVLTVTGLLFIWWFRKQIRREQVSAA